MVARDHNKTCIISCFSKTISNVIKTNFIHPWNYHKLEQHSANIVSSATSAVYCIESIGSFFVL